jgi:drug/metabolite transporter (DMT)-like permease
MASFSDATVSRRPGLGFVMALTGGTLFGIAGTVAAGLFSSMSPAHLNQYRLVLAAVFLSLIAARKGLMHHGGMFGWLVLLGVITAAITFVFFVAVDRLGVGPGITIQYLGPILMLVYRRVVQRLQIPITGWFGAMAAVVGIGLITGAFTADYADVIGVLAGLAAAVLYAAMTITAEKLGKKLHPLTYASYSLTVAALIWLAVLPVDVPQLSIAGWAGVAWVSIGAMGVGYLLLMSALRHISPGPMGVAATSEPIVGTLTAWVALSQALSTVEMIGVGLTALGIAVVHGSIRRSPGF